MQFSLLDDVFNDAAKSQSLFQLRSKGVQDTLGQHRVEFNMLQMGHLDLCAFSELFLFGFALFLGLNH